MKRTLAAVAAAAILTFGWASPATAATGVCTPTIPCPNTGPAAPAPHSYWENIREYHCRQTHHRLVWPWPTYGTHIVCSEHED